MTQASWIVILQINLGPLFWNLFLVRTHTCLSSPPIYNCIFSNNIQNIISNLSNPQRPKWKPIFIIQCTSISRGCYLGATILWWTQRTLATIHYVEQSTKHRLRSNSRSLRKFYYERICPLEKIYSSLQQPLIVVLQTSQAKSIIKHN